MEKHLKSNCELYMSGYLKSRLTNLGFFFVFVSGVLFAFIVFYFYSVLFSLRKPLIHHHMPDNKYLQLRDDVSLMPMVFKDNNFDNFESKKAIETKKDKDLMDGK